MKKVKKAFLAAAAAAIVLALTACRGTGADNATSATTTEKALQTTAQAVKETKTTAEQTTATRITAETTTETKRQVDTRTTEGETPVTEETTRQQVWEPVTEAPGHNESGTTAHQHSWEWVEPVTHVETIYETVYHPPVTHEWTHLVSDGNQFRCLRCNSVFLDARECVEHCIVCGGSMTTETHYVEVTETIVDQEEYWSEEPVGTRTVTDSEGYWKCPGCGSVK